jgi:hypothetical protein
VDPFAFPTVKYQPGLAQDSHMSRYFGLRFGGGRTDIADAQFSGLPEKHDDGEPGFIRQDFEKLNRL